MSRLLTLLLACAALAACERPQLSRGGGLPTLKLNDAVGGQIGGPDTCLMVLDAATGASRYQYGLPSVCNRPLPPCATFEAPNALIALDAGLITPQAVLKWDGSPQPLSAWQKDADLATAFGQSIAWWDQALAARIGAPLYAQRLKALDYGSARPEGPLAHFWMGPAQGGGLVPSSALRRPVAGQG